MVSLKQTDCGPDLTPWPGKHISHTPILWSAYGRPHSNTFTVLRTLSKCISCRRNVATEQAVYRRLHAQITVEIWRRKTRQVRSCWPAAELTSDVLYG